MINSAKIMTPSATNNVPNKEKEKANIVMQ
jgi:hypothetical protein